jgi:acetyl esterase/lipase
MDSNNKKYKYITVNDKAFDVMNHPAFKGFGFYLFPWNDKNRYSKDMTMKDVAPLHLWHTNINAQEEVDGVNRLIDDINKGYKVFYDIYTEEEKKKDPQKQYTGLFFLRGKKNAPYMIMLPGGGYYYVGVLHEGLPVIKEINKYGYNTFVLKYRVDGGGKYLDDYEYRASKDLIRAVHFIEEHSEELGVSKENYSLWGGSAGARTVSDAVYAEAGITQEESLKPALAVIAYVFFTDKSIFTKDDSPGFFIVGKNDALVSWRDVKERVDNMKKGGCIVEAHIIDNLRHGFGVGKGTPAEGWIETAIKFWEKNMKK